MRSPRSCALTRSVPASSSLYVRNMPRRANDFYPTPAWATMELLNRISLSGMRILEPCAGDGAIANVLKRTWGDDRVFATDIDPKFLDTSDGVFDACDNEIYNLVKPDAIITNPPFSLAHVIVPKAVEKANLVAMLLRLSWLEPVADRAEWLAKNPPDRLLVLPRISFTGDGKTDSVTCAWFVWETTPFRAIHPIEIIPTFKQTGG